MNEKTMARTTTTTPVKFKAASKREQSQARLSSAEREQARATLKVLMNHIYELHKGVRHMVLFTCNKKYSEQTIKRLESQGIPYLLQPAGLQNLNIYFGRRECLEAIRHMSRRIRTCSAYACSSVRTVRRGHSRAWLRG